VVVVAPTVLRASIIDSTPAHAVLHGHLLPHVLGKGEVELVAVLRCEPSVLRARLLERGYPQAKVTENVEAELIGVLLDECVARFGEDLVREYDTTSSSPKEVAGSIARDAMTRGTRKGRMKKNKNGRGGVEPLAWIDWTLDYDSSSKLRSLLGKEGGAGGPTGAGAST
jgi:broad-specificity NMP kinase